MTIHLLTLTKRLLDQSSSTSTQQQSSSQQQKGPQTFVYIVLGLLIFGFIFFVVNTIRCYLTRPRNADFEDEQMMEEEMGSTELGHSSPEAEDRNKPVQKLNK